MYGGLGNQLFIYAFAFYLKQRGFSVCIDATEYYLSSKRQLDITSLNLDNKIPFIIKKIPKFRYSSFFYKTLTKIFYTFIGDYITTIDQKVEQKILTKKLSKHTYFDNYWLNAKYPLFSYSFFSQIFLAQKTKHCVVDLKNRIKKMKDTCFIHIRRGDYLDSKNWDFAKLGVAYYASAINTILHKYPSCFFLVFSDDLQWAKTDFPKLIAPHINTKRKDVFIFTESTMSNIEDMYLMHICKNGIIANSTFSWWGAFLIKNPQKIICTPAFFHYNPSRDCSTDLYIKDWVAIDNIWGYKL